MNGIAAIEMQPRVDRGKMGVWWFLASEVMTFGGFISVYVLYRLASGGSWAEMSAYVSMPIGAFNTLVLLTSSLTMVKAVSAIEDEDRQGTRNFLGLTVLLGLLFLVVKGVEYSIEIHHGFTPRSHSFWGFYYTLTGLHALHIVGGIIANFVLFILAVRGSLWLGSRQQVESVGLYWHFVDIIWIFLFPLLYLSY